jgi:SPP1 family phage portal protein
MGFLSNMIKPISQPMSQEDIIHTYIQDFESSKTRKDMRTGERYYKNENDINQRKLYKYVDGSKVEDTERPNNKLSHSFAKLLVDEKVNYLLGKSPIIAADDEKFQEKLIDILDDEFDDTIQEIGIESSNKGIAWLQPYIDEEGSLKFEKHDSEKIIPIWKESSHKTLEAIIRVYYIETYEGKDRKDVKKVEYWTKDDVTYYTYFNGSMVPDVEAPGESEPIGHFRVNDGEYKGWGLVPFIPFKNNNRELNDLTYFKTLIDDYDKNTSDTSNTLDDIARFIYILKDYGGTDLGEFLSDLKLYKAIKVNGDGGVDKLSPDIEIEAVEKHLDRIKKDVYIFGQGVDMDTDKFGNSPSGIALQFLYSALDLKCDQMERKFKKAFKSIFWFIAEYFKTTNQGICDPKKAKVTFVRSMIINETDTITNIRNSKGIVSDKTLLEHHPYVGDVDEEENRKKEERKNTLEPPLKFGNSSSGSEIDE